MEFEFGLFFFQLLLAAVLIVVGLVLVVFRRRRSVAEGTNTGAEGERSFRDISGWILISLGAALLIQRFVF